MNVMRIVLAATCCVLSVFLASCKAAEKPHDEHAHHADAHDAEAHEEAHEEKPGEHAHADHDDGAKPQALPLAGIRGVAFLTAPEPRAEGAWFPAEAIGDVESQRVLTAPVGGILTALLVSPGRSLAKGVPLATVESPELAALVAARLTAEARLERARTELSREDRLLAAGAGAPRDVESARADVTLAEAEVASARLALSARGLGRPDSGAVFTLRAPAAGNVVAWSVRVGQGLEAGQALGSYQAGTSVLAAIELTPPGPSSWKPGAVTEARGEGGVRWKAVLEGIPFALNPETRRLSYRLRLSGANLPLPGVPLEVHVPLATAVILPQTALQQIEGVWGVFRKDGESAAFVPVRRGAELGSDVMVLEGVSPGDVLVTEGAYLLKTLQLRRSGGGGDDHGH